MMTREEGARDTAYMMIDTLSDRKGFDHWWENIDKETEDEIIKELSAIILEHHE